MIGGSYLSLLGNLLRKLFNDSIRSVTGPAGHAISRQLWLFSNKLYGSANVLSKREISGFQRFIFKDSIHFFFTVMI